MMETSRFSRNNDPASLFSRLTPLMTDAFSLGPQSLTRTF
jgi:hypothetical protein